MITNWRIFEMKTLIQQTIQNLIWIREMRIAGGLDVDDIDAKIAKLKEELINCHG